MNRFFHFFENLARPLERPDPGRPPAGGIGFILHFARQLKGGFTAMLVLGGLTALIEAFLFVMVGLLVDMMNGAKPETFMQGSGTDNLEVFFTMTKARCKFDGPFEQELHRRHGSSELRKDLSVCVRRAISSLPKLCSILA